MSHESFREQVTRYVIGGLVALALTSIAFWLISEGAVGGLAAAVVILLMACVQVIVQLYFFLHLADDRRPSWRQYSLVFTVLILLIIVVGSLWIMWNLNYNMGMTPEQMNEYMIEQNKVGF